MLFVDFIKKTWTGDNQTKELGWLKGRKFFFKTCEGEAAVEVEGAKLTRMHRKRQYKKIKLQGSKRPDLLGF